MSAPGSTRPFSRRLTGNALCFIAGFTLIAGLLPALTAIVLYGLGLLDRPQNWTAGHAKFIGFHMAFGLVLYPPFALLRRLMHADTRKAQSRLAALLAVSPPWLYAGNLVYQAGISINDHGFGELLGSLAMYSCLLVLAGGFAGALAGYQRQDPKRCLRIMATDIRQGARHGGQFILRKLTDQAWSQVRRQSLGRCAVAFLLLALLFSGLLVKQTLASRNIAILGGEMHVDLNHMRRMAEQPSLLKGDPKTFAELAAVTDHLDGTWNAFRPLPPGTGKDWNEAGTAWLALRANTRSLVALQPELQHMHARQLALRSGFEQARKQLEPLRERLLGIMLARKEPVRHIAQIQDLQAILSQEAATLDEIHATLYEGRERDAVQEDGVGMYRATGAYLEVLDELLSDRKSPPMWYSPQEWQLDPVTRPVIRDLRNTLAAWVLRRESSMPNFGVFLTASQLRIHILIQSRELDRQVQHLAARQPEPGGLLFLSLASWLCFSLSLYGMVLAQRPGWESPAQV